MILSSLSKQSPSSTNITCVYLEGPLGFLAASPDGFSSSQASIQVTALDSGAVLWKSNRLEKGDQLLLPVDTLVFLLKVHKRIASFAVPDVGQTGLDTQSHVVADYLHRMRENFGKKERERAYKAVIINGVDVLLLGNHVAKATASGILEGNAGSLGAQNPVDVIAVVELIVKPVGDPDSL
nr:hypothetical protein C4D60_Mb10t20400 [Ipomoea batatas]